MVNCVIKGRAAAFFLPGAAPPQIVVAEASPPEGINVRNSELSGKPAVKRLLQLVNTVAETVLRDDAHRDMIALFGLQHLVTLPQTRRHRLFDEHVLARIHRVDGNLRMSGRRRADVHEINLNAGSQHLLVIVKYDSILQAVLLFDGLCFFRINIAERHDLHSVRERQKSLNMCV